MGGAVAPSVRFYRHFTKSENGCWEWTGGVFKDSGYGKFNAGYLGEGKSHTVYTHRFSFTLHVGPIPPGLFVLHRCDNRKCVNPEHLFIGTQQDNIDDMFAKGRARPQGKTPITPTGIEEIRSAPRSDATRLSRKFAICPSHIRRIRRDGHNLRARESEHG